MSGSREEILDRIADLKNSVDREQSDWYREVRKVMALLRVATLPLSICRIKAIAAGFGCSTPISACQRGMSWIACRFGCNSEIRVR